MAVGGRMVVIGVGAGARVELNLLALMASRSTIGGSMLRARTVEEKSAVARAVAEHAVPLLADGQGDGAGGRAAPHGRGRGGLRAVRRRREVREDRPRQRVTWPAPARAGRVYRETMTDEPWPNRPWLAVIPTLAPSTWRAPARPRSCHTSSHTWAMAWAGMASPKQDRPAAGVDRHPAPDGGVAVAEQPLGLALLAQHDVLVPVELEGRGEVVDLGQVDVLGADAGLLVGGQGHRLLEGGTDGVGGGGGVGGDVGHVEHGLGEASG